MEKPVWWGLVEARPLDGNEYLAPDDGAYLYVFAPADSAEEFVAAALELMAKGRFAVRDIDDVEPFAEARAREALEAEYLELADEVEASQLAAVHDRFHVFPANSTDDDAEDD